MLGCLLDTAAPRLGLWFGGYASAVDRFDPWRIAGLTTGLALGLASVMWLRERDQQPAIRGPGMFEGKSVYRTELLALTDEIVAAHVGNNAISGPEVGALIQSVFDALNRLATEPSASVELTPAVPVRRLVTDDHLVCVEDGK